MGAARPGEGEGLPAILAEEQENDDEYNSAFNRAKRWIAANALLISLLLAGAAVTALFLLARTTTEHTTSVPEYLPEPPDDARPALAYGLAKEGGDSTDTVLATLLDLVDRGYYRRPRPRPRTRSSTWPRREDRAAADAAGALRARGPGVLRQAARGRHGPDERDAGPDPRAQRELAPSLEAMTAALDGADQGQLIWDRNVNGKRWLLAGATIAAFAIVILCRRSVGDSWWGPGILGALTLLALVAYPGARLKRLAPEYGARSARWKAFERWIDDFPTLEDDPPATLELWKRILVFGVAFGTAERMIESGRIPAPVMESASAGWSTYYFHGGVSDTAFDGSAFGSASRPRWRPSPPAAEAGAASRAGAGALRRGRRRRLVGPTPPTAGRVRPDGRDDQRRRGGRPLRARGLAGPAGRARAAAGAARGARQACGLGGAARVRRAAAGRHRALQPPRRPLPLGLLRPVRAGSCGTRARTSASPPPTSAASRLYSRRSARG